MTLTELSYYTRKAMPFVVIAILVILILFYALKLMLFAVQTGNKPPQLVINPVFGKIKKPSLKNVLKNANYTYTLDTIEGQPVTATEAAKVFAFIPSNTQFKYMQQIYVMAQAVGFNTEITRHKLISNTTAQFADDKQTMEIDISTYNFVYEYDLKILRNDETFFTDGIVPDKETIEGQATTFLNSVGRYPEELAKGKKNIVYLTYSPDINELVIAPKDLSSNMVEVDLYRPDIDTIPIVTPTYFNSQNYVILAFGNNSTKIIKSQVQYREISTVQIGLYPLKSGSSAWEELKAQRGLIISGPSDSTSIVVRKMFLGYLDPETGDDYMQPVYVFIGDGNFVGYVPAVDAAYLTE